MAIVAASSECSVFIQNLGRDETPVHRFPSPMQIPVHVFHSARSHQERRVDTLSCRATSSSNSSSSGRLVDEIEGQICGFLSSSTFGRAGCAKGLGFSNRRKNRQEDCVVCKAGDGIGVGSSEWLSKATPYEVLGVSADSSEEDIKSAFRAMIKEYHPDVYQGLRDADAITQRLIRAYEVELEGIPSLAIDDFMPASNGQLLTGDDVGRAILIKRKSFDPFEEPECVAEDVFVNELACIGRGCPYSCVERAPDVFQFAPETGCARAQNQDDTTRRGGYAVELAVGQCPRNCIHYVTPEQRFLLEEMLKSVLEGTVYSGEAAIMDGLIARAKFENGRYQAPMRKKPTKSEKWVDWY